MTPQEYYDMLARFDWDYARSDDHEVYCRGMERERYLRSLSQSDEALRRLWERFRKYRLGLTNEKPKRPRA